MIAQRMGLHGFTTAAHMVPDVRLEASAFGVCTRSGQSPSRARCGQAAGLLRGTLAHSREFGPNPKGHLHARMACAYGARCETRTHMTEVEGF